MEREHGAEMDEMRQAALQEGRLEEGAYQVLAMMISTLAILALFLAVALEPVFGLMLILMCGVVAVRLRYRSGGAGRCCRC